ncbi:MAG: hypothetical protein EBV77_03645, partial [Gemmatimonadaceae bacterium]|nr:hypothetical protein [Gemmatimonadaceae bacterium]
GGGNPLEIALSINVGAALVALAAWVLFGGPALFKAPPLEQEAMEPVPFRPRHAVTFAVGAVWVAGVLFLKLPPGLTAFAAAGVLVLAGVGDDTSPA